MRVWPKRVAVLLLVTMLGSCADNTPIRVGFIGGLTGRFADLGSSGQNGAIMAVEWRNTRGGIDGRPVTLLIRDDEHQPEKARQALRSLIADNVTAVVGPMTSAMATEIVPLANETRTVLVGGTIVTRLLTGKDDYMIRVISDSSVYASQTARQIHQAHPGQRTAVVFDLANRDYSEDWANSYAAEAARLGNHEVALYPFDSRIPESASNLIGNTLLATKNLPPHLIVMVCSSRDAAIIARATRQRAPEISMAAAAWAATEQLIEQGQTSVEGMFVEQYHNVDESGETFRTFRGEYRQRFGRNPDYAAVVAFDAMNLLLDALTTHPERKGLREAILARRQFSGLNGLITLDAHGDATRPYFAATIKGGHYQDRPPSAKP